MAINTGGIVAYPTESVFGLGGDAANEQVAGRIINLKQRVFSKGLITIISDLDQVLGWLDHDYKSHWAKALDCWPAAVTWLFPAGEQAPAWLTGGGQRIALRIPDHPVARELCNLSGKALISSSANRSGDPPAVTSAEVIEQFSDQIDAIVDRQCGSRVEPSQIRDLTSGNSVR